MLGVLGRECQQVQSDAVSVSTGQNIVDLHESLTFAGDSKRSCCLLGSLQIGTTSLRSIKVYTLGKLRLLHWS
jgi:hypothetical protein